MGGSEGPVYYAPGGDPERMLGMAVDITGRKENEASLRRKEIELQEAQRLAGVGSWQWEPATDTVVWSEELSRIAGRDPRLPPVSYKGHSQLYTSESWDRLEMPSKGPSTPAHHTNSIWRWSPLTRRTDGPGHAEAQRDTGGASQDSAAPSRTSRSASVPKRRCPP